MKRIFSAILAAGALLMTLSACGSSAGRGALENRTGAEAQEVLTSDVSLETSKEAPKIRVVALMESVGEMWLLAGGELVGITEDGTGLSGLSEDVATIGTTHNPNLEAILALKPDIVIISNSVSAQTELIPVFEEAGIKVYAPEINSFEDYADTLKEYTALTNRPDLYEKNVLKVQEEIEAVKAKADSSVKASYLAVRVSATKNRVLKDDYFACKIISDLGLKNIAEDNSSLDELNVEAIAAADPEYIFVVLQGKEDEALDSYKKALTDNPVWGSLSAVKNDKVFILPKDMFQYKPNARWGEAYEYIYELVY
ncbi:MAG: ABC transporter substrate-binding protein [Lachnospiraceae bacterium]|nr:ABC transporter substrate-binding protein [Lachnospiraceae bacterium]